MIHTLNQAEQDYTLSTVERLPLDRCSSPGSFDKLTRMFIDLENTWNGNAMLRIFRCRSIMLQIFSEIFHDLGKSASPRRNTEQILKVADYLKKYYARKHTLTELAGIAELTPSYFGQNFKALTGETPMEYLNSIRVDKALAYMAVGHSIREASLKCGFNDAFYFTRVFKQKKGMSPSEYMNRGELML